MAQVSQEPLSATTSPSDLGAAVTPEKIVFSVQRIVDIAKPRRILAFGSRVRKEHRPDSDLDLAVVVESYEPKLGLPPVTRSDIDIWMPLDLVVYDLKRERELSDSLNTLQSVVKREGVLLYDCETGIIDRRAVERLV